MRQVTREEVAAALQPLIGQPLVHWSRAADMALLHFGALHETEGRRGPFEIGEWALHIQSAWRVVRNGQIVVGNLDHFSPPLGIEISEDDFDPSEAPRNLRDDLQDEFLAHAGAPHVVVAVEGTSMGDLSLTFSDGCALEAFGWAAQRSEARHEFWRFFRIEGDDHFVVTTAGLEE